jgi:hypothetical protein
MAMFMVFSRPGRYRQEDQLPETAGHGTGNPALASDWLNRTAMDQGDKEGKRRELPARLRDSALG